MASTGASTRQLLCRATRHYKTRHESEAAATEHTDPPDVTWSVIMYLVVYWLFIISPAVVFARLRYLLHYTPILIVYEREVATGCTEKLCLCGWIWI